MKENLIKLKYIKCYYTDYLQSTPILIQHQNPEDYFAVYDFL